MTTFNYTSFGDDLVLLPEFNTYTNGRLAVSLLYKDTEFDTFFPFAKVTVNMPEIHLNEGEVLVKDWSENEALVAHLVEQGWIIPTGREVSSGFVFPMVATLAGPLTKEN